MSQVSLEVSGDSVRHSSRPCPPRHQKPHRKSDKSEDKNRPAQGRFEILKEIPQKEGHTGRQKLGKKERVSQKDSEERQYTLPPKADPPLAENPTPILQYIPPSVEALLPERTTRKPHPPPTPQNPHPQANSRPQTANSRVPPPRQNPGPNPMKFGSSPANLRVLTR